MAIPVVGTHRAGGPGSGSSHDRLAPDDLRPDDAVRRLLPAGRHRRLRAPGAERARPVASWLRRTWPPRRPTRSPPRPTRAAGGDVLRVPQVLMQFGGLKALNQVDLRPARHHPRPDRAERLRQEHDDERAHRHLRADRRRHLLRRALAHRAHAGAHRAVGHRAHLPERAAVRRDDGAAERAGGPAPQLPRATCSTWRCTRRATGARARPRCSARWAC
jgi:hypothetical protein